MKLTRDRLKQATMGKGESFSEDDAVQRSILTFYSLEDIESISKLVPVPPKASPNYFSVATGSQRQITQCESYLIGPLCTNKVAVRS